MRAVITNLFQSGSLGSARRAIHIRLTNKEMFLIWQQKATMTINYSRLFIIRIPTVKDIEIRVVPECC